MDEKTKTPKEQKKDKRRNFTSQMWAIILGTTISLIVTIVAAQILERNRRTAFSEEMDDVRDAVLYHPDQYSGSSWGSKYLSNPIFRQVLRNFHNMRCWLQNKIEKIRYHNYVNMVTIGITEQELLEFIEMREKEVEVDREKPGDNIYTPNINPDSITTIHIPLPETAN